MPLQITWERRANTLNLDDRVAILGNADNRLEIWPALGMNAYRWRVGGHELLYRSPPFFDEMKPTRSGFPVLFPFPNRIRDGRFTWDGQSYALPINDPASKNAIHGFAHVRPWRLVDQGGSAESVWIVAEFHAGVDAPEALGLWPADHRVRIKYQLFDRVLRVEADVDNPDVKSLPFGLGYHPYFALAPFGGSQANVTVAASRRWELIDNLPTGNRIDLGEACDMRQGRRFADLTLDDLLTGLYSIARDPQEGLGLVGVIQHPSGDRLLSLWVSDGFRELVAFTPPHREAICLEPYTCTTDAINLSARGIDAGLIVLKPGATWRGVVEVHLAG